MKHTTYGVSVLALALLAAGARLPGAGAPLADHNVVRQADTAAIARGLYRSGFDVLRPEYLGGGPGPHSVESEFPLYPALAALGYLAAGVYDD